MINIARKEKIKMVTLRGVATRKRCRKPERVFLEGRGLNVEQAIEDLEEKIKSSIKTFKQYEFHEKIFIQDAERTIYEDGSTCFSHEIDFGHLNLPFVGWEVFSDKEILQNV